MTHICVGKLTIIDSDNGLSPGRCQAIIWTNAGILLIGPLWTNFNEILIGIQTFSFKKMHLKMAFAKWRPFCLGLNVLMYYFYPTRQYLCGKKTFFLCASHILLMIEFTHRFQWIIFVMIAYIRETGRGIFQVIDLHLQIRPLMHMSTNCINFITQKSFVCNIYILQLLWKSNYKYNFS